MEIQFGDPRMPTRFWDKVSVNTETGCWEWTGHKNRGGYGYFSRRTDDIHRTALAHRAGFIALRFDPGELVCDHLCRVRHCVNPNHLRAVTSAENILCGIGPTAENLSKTHCPRGHEYSGDNVVIRTHANGGECRYCRTCENAHYGYVRKTDHADRRTGHGTAGKYKAGCRCRECKDQQRDRMRTYRARRNASKINLAPGTATLTQDGRLVSAATGSAF